MGQFRAGERRIVSWLLGRRLVGTVRLFEFFIDRESRAPQKVGQCAVAVAWGKVTFLDCIHLKPAQRHLWDQCFKLIVQRFGAKAYHYGSHWNHEDRSKLAAIPGFATQTVLDKQFHLDLIDFHDWAGFPAYCRGISENIRRDYRKARSTSARVETRFGLAALRDVFALVTLRAQVMHASRLDFAAISDVSRRRRLGVLQLVSRDDAPLGLEFMGLVVPSLMARRKFHFDADFSCTEIKCLYSAFCELAPLRGCERARVAQGGSDRN